MLTSLLKGKFGLNPGVELLPDRLDVAKRR
jgi:hypothetical protein